MAEIHQEDHQAEQKGDEEGNAHQVDLVDQVAPIARQRIVFRHPHQGQRRRHRRQGQVDQEDSVPTEGAGQDPAQHGPYGHRGDGGQGQHTHGDARRCGVAMAIGLHAEDAHGGGIGSRRADAQQDARSDQHAQRR